MSILLRKGLTACQASRSDFCLFSFLFVPKKYQFEIIVITFLNLKQKNYNCVFDLTRLLA